MGGGRKGTRKKDFHEGKEIRKRERMGINAWKGKRCKQAKKEERLKRRK